MADKIVLTLEIAGVQREIKSVQDLKKALKDAKNEMLGFDEGSAGFAKAQKNISQLQDKINGLGDSTRIQGTGVERLGQSFGFLRESLATGDIDKAKLAFTGMGQAMSAIPIFLIIEGLRLLMENFGEVSRVFKEFFGVVSDSEMAVAKLNDELARQQFANKIHIQQIEDEIALMKVQGASEEEILKRKKEITDLKIKEIEIQLELNKHKLTELRNNIETMDVLKGTYALMLNIAGLNKNATLEALKIAEDRLKREKEVKNQIAEGEASIAHLRNMLNVEVVENEVKVTKSKKDEADKRKKIAEDEAAEKIKMEQYVQGRMADLENAKIDAEQKRKDAAKAAEKKKNEDFDKDEAKTRLEENARLNEHIKAQSQAAADEEKRLAEEQAAARTQAFETGLTATKNLSDAYFAYKLNKVKGDAQAEQKIRKQMFEVDKAFNISRAVIDGVRGVQAALTIPPPAGPILAVVNGVAAAANVAKIASTKFESGPTVGASIPSAPSMPTVNTVQTIRQPSTRLDEDGRPVNVNANVKAYVVATEMTDRQKAMQRIKDQSSFG